MPNFYTLITEAIADFEQHGYDSEDRLNKWLEAINTGARALMPPAGEVQDALTRSLKAIFTREVDSKGALKHHKVSAFTIDNIKPQLRNELQRRIMASAQLIKLNREQAMSKTLQRFSGWATSIPAGGSKAIDKPEVKEDVKKALRSLPYEEKRVIIDQGHKFTASINNMIAMDGGAIAAIWHSRFRQRGYDARPDHAERDGHIMLIRDSWAYKDGYAKAGKYGFTDQITAPGEEVFCRCSFQYVYSLRELPDDMLTVKGREKITKKSTQFKIP